jgi:solute carrier family 25 S-adenosylmethionine transporter 26
VVLGTVVSSPIVSWHFLQGIRGLYRGYFSTVVREIPFSAIQYPLWELFKRIWSDRQHKQVDPWQAAICGALSGGIAAFLTTPLDVVKTRIMLADKQAAEANTGYVNVLKNVWLEEGVRGLFAGVVPRVLWISFGGFVFLGAYEKATSLISGWVSHN